MMYRVFWVTVLFCLAIPARAEPPALATCTACHGRDGLAVTADAPHISGQPLLYLRKQLYLFRDGGRHDPQMSPFSRSLSDDDIDALAAWYSALPLPPGQGEADPDLSPFSRPLVFCVRCHGRDGVSPNDYWPSLAGQKTDYMRAQMHAFGRGERRDALMSMWGELVAGDDLEAILGWFRARGRAANSGD